MSIEQAFRCYADIKREPVATQPTVIFDCKNCVVSNRVVTGDKNTIIQGITDLKQGACDRIMIKNGA
jgi:hypothetical protein